MKLSNKFEEALIYATRAHGNQMRKKTGIPYVAHILGVTAIALSTARMRPKRSARFFMTRWKIAVARNDCAIFENDLAMMSPGSLMVAPIPMRRQSHRGWNENALTSSISRILTLRRGWYQRPTSCITRVRSWLSFEETVWKYLNALPGKR